MLFTVAPAPLLLQAGQYGVLAARVTVSGTVFQLFAVSVAEALLARTAAVVRAASRPAGLLRPRMPHPP
ncbi:hypothetical protein [Kitasatospora sp. NPDC087315]|uniref:hypothetical protein n=1 Tax=Kitasatospora sp. NPDC087315 TaxID=3364069 RepID=UPI0037F49C32